MACFTTLLEHLTQAGNGRYYFTKQITDIPQLVTKETTIATRAALAAGGFEPRVQDASALLQGLAQTSLPILRGYVQTTSRPRTTVALASDRGDPILAHWYYGLGRAVAWTPDIGGPWTMDWLAWPGVADFLANSVRWTMPPAVGAELRPDAEVHGHQVSLRLRQLARGWQFRRWPRNPRHRRDTRSARALTHSDADRAGPLRATNQRRPAWPLSRPVDATGRVGRRSRGGFRIRRG
jgi:Putative glutamine amidotransferase